MSRRAGNRDAIVERLQRAAALLDEAVLATPAFRALSAPPLPRAAVRDDDPGRPRMVVVRFEDIADAT